MFATVWHRDARRPSDIDWSITKDLAYRAHQALERELEQQLPVKSLVTKRIPVGGGLGGGSSNAAAMLRALDALFELGLPTERLASIAAGLGSDVPFLVHGGSAIVGGLGDRIEPLVDVPDAHVVLVFPEVPCPTPAVYRCFDERGGTQSKVDDARVRALAASVGAERVPSDAPFNDLAAPALDVAPTLTAHVRAIAEIAEREVHVSGSGSTLFTVCDDPMHAQALADAIERRTGLPAVAARAAAPAPPMLAPS
jgi:4-diphosphocytidyl-2-C-methyl-D-erythritol kinase